MVQTALFYSRKEQTSSETENSMTQRFPMKTGLPSISSLTP